MSLQLIALATACIIAIGGLVGLAKTWIGFKKGKNREHELEAELAKLKIDLGQWMGRAEVAEEKLKPRTLTVVQHNIVRT